MPFWLVNTLIVLMVIFMLRSGLKGEAALIKTGGWTIAPLVILGIPYLHGWGGAVIWLATLFVGYVIATIKDIVAEGRQKGQ